MFESASLKLERADHHIADLEGQFAAFVAEKPHRFGVHVDPQSGEAIVRVRFVKELPPALALVIGDAVHNLRVVLDHMVWELVGIDGGTQNRHTKLPTGDNRVSFKAAANGIVTPGQWVKDFLAGLEVCPDGQGKNIYALNSMDNADKHTVLTPVARATSHPKFSILNREGRPIITLEGNVFIGGFEHQSITNVPPGCSVELQDDADCPPSIFFGQPSVPVIPTLKQWRAEIAAILEAANAAIP